MSRRSIVSTAMALRRGELSCRELIDEAIASRHEAHAAYRSVDDEGARDKADAVDQAIAAGFDLGPWMGIPFSVKDLLGVPGFPTFAGTDNPLPPDWERAGPLVGALHGRLAIAMGKTQAVEFGYGGLGINAHGSIPRNPYAPAVHRVAGGSSSGAGVSLAEGSCMLALGTDTAGSVRVPASYTGNIGFKPTRGRWSTDGIVPLSPTLDTPGVLVRSVDDLRLAFATLDPKWESPAQFLAEGPRVIVPDLRIARCSSLFWDDCSPGVAETVEDALAALEEAGARIHDAEFTEFQPTYELFCTGRPAKVELHQFLQTRLPHRIAALGPDVAARLEGAEAVSAGQYLDDLRRIRAWSKAVEAKLRHFDMLVAPTVALSPPAVDDLDTPEAYRRHNLLALRNTCIANFLGLCAVTLPVGLDDAGMPVGLMLMTRPGHDERLVAYATVLEPLIVHWTRPPAPRSLVGV